jgi:hypothetical protein
MVMSIAYIDDQNLFEMTLPIAVLSGENSNVKEAIIIMRQRHGDAWFISRFVSVFSSAPKPLLMLLSRVE